MPGSSRWPVILDRMRGRVVRRKRTWAGGTAALAVCAGTLLSACGSQVALPAAGSAVPTAEPLPTVTSTYEPETPIGMDLDTIDRLFASPIIDEVVEGTVTAIDFEATQDFPQTRITLTVERARGTAAPEITYWEMGGIFLESDLRRSMSRPPKRGATSEAPDPSPADRVLDIQPPWGAPRAAVGDRIVVFLHAVSAKPDDGYFAVPGTLGRFISDGTTGDYVRAGTFSNWEKVLTRERVERELTPLP